MIQPIEIDKIPVKKAKIKDLIKADIQEAIDKGITKFEFVGDYNYKYLKQYAQYYADRMVYNMVSKAYYKYRETELTELEKHGEGFYLIPKAFNDSHKRFITISSVAGDDRRRVFCEIDFSDFDDIIRQCFEQDVQSVRDSHFWNGKRWEVKNDRED